MAGCHLLDREGISSFTKGPVFCIVNSFFVSSWVFEDEGGRAESRSAGQLSSHHVHVFYLRVGFPRKGWRSSLMNEFPFFFSGG